ncbi:MAG: glycerol acyltransferase [Sulfurovum sp.]|nr:MAG: glycerol acyltransferase [Sulfurovum sp.]
MKRDKQTNLRKIEKEILEISDLVKEIAVIVYDGYLLALIYPDFQKAKEHRILHLENEIKWYAVELYNIEAHERYKIKEYKIVGTPLPKDDKGEIDRSKLAVCMQEQISPAIIIEEEPRDIVYQHIKKFLSTLSREPILLSSHLELDLHLDSLNYVELLTFIDQSFAVHITESEFSQMMILKELYHYVSKNKQKITDTEINWHMILSEKIDYEPVTSSAYLKVYRALFLPLFKLYFSLTIHHPENIPKQPCIIVPNHQSMLDGFMMMAALPKGVSENTFSLAFEMVFGTKIMGFITKRAQSILIDYNKSLKTSMQKSASILSKGHHLLIFPEGARTRDRKLLEFKKFFAILSIELDIPVVPVVLDGTFEALPTGKLFPRPLPVIIKYLKPVYPKGLSYDEMTAKVKKAIDDEMTAHPLH